MTLVVFKQYQSVPTVQSQDLQSLIFIPMGLQSDGFSTKAALRSLSQMAQRLTFPLQPLCT